jgi:hypothetical protein
MKTLFYYIDYFKNDSDTLGEKIWLTTGYDWDLIAFASIAVFITVCVLFRKRPELDK